MTNIVDAADRFPQKPPLDVDLPLQLAQRLFSAGKISRHALFIGAIVLSRFQQEGKYQCFVTRQLLAQTFCTVNGEPFSASVNCEMSELASALYALQTYCGLYNHIKADRVGKARERGSHFTEPYRYGEGDSLYSVIESNTPIHFRWFPERQDEIVEEAKKDIAHGLMIAKFADIKTTKIHL